MERNIIRIFIIGIIFVISMGFRSYSPGANILNDSGIAIIKGQVFNSDRDHDWEKVTFGVSGFDPCSYNVYAIILDKQGNFISEVDHLSNMHFGGGAYWYSVDLRHISIHKDFFLEVHVVRKTGLNNSISTQVLRGTVEAPIDPDETVLILKYP